MAKPSDVSWRSPPASWIQTACLLQAHARDQVLAVGGHGGPLLFGRPERDLLGRAIGIPLPPDVKAAAGVRREVHPAAVRRPRRGRALGFLRADGASRRRSIEGHQPARKPSASVHLDDEQRLPIGRTHGAMRHAAVPSRKIDVPGSDPALGRGHNPHVNARHDRGIEDVLIVQPHESRRIRKKWLRGSAKHGHLPRVPFEPWHHGRIDDA